MTDTFEKMEMETPDLTAQNIDKIAALFPNCITEMEGVNDTVKRGINFEMLKQMLFPDVVDGDECYEFTRVGKKAAIVEANKPIRKTLRPCPEESKDWDTTEKLYIGQSGSTQAAAGGVPGQGEDDLHRPALQYRQRLHLCRRLHALAGRGKRSDGDVRRGRKPPVQEHRH